MTFENLAYWLQGYIEINGVSGLSAAQVQIIKDHLDLVFQKVTPDPIDWYKLMTPTCDHEYESPYWGISPSPCKKCGKFSIPNFTITYDTSAGMLGDKPIC